MANWTIDAWGDDASTPDENEAEEDPYVNGNDSHDKFNQPGEQGGAIQIAKFKDRQSICFPPGIQTIVTTFELNAFCSDGAISGDWLGKLRWEWSQTQGSAPTLQVFPSERSLPSNEFMDALISWCGLQGFPFPDYEDIPSAGGTPCSSVP